MRLPSTQFAVAFVAVTLITVAYTGYVMAQGDTFGTQTDQPAPPSGGDSGSGGIGISIPGFGGQSTQQPKPKAPLPVAIELRALIEEAADRGGFNSSDEQRAHQLEGELLQAPRYFPPSHPSPIACLDLMVGAAGAAEREAFAVQKGPSLTSDDPNEQADLARSDGRRGVCCYAANANGQNEALAGDNCPVIAQAPSDETQRHFKFRISQNETQRHFKLGISQNGRNRGRANKERAKATVTQWGSGPWKILKGRDGTSYKVRVSHLNMTKTLSSTPVKAVSDPPPIWLQPVAVYKLMQYKPGKYQVNILRLATIQKNCKIASTVT